MKPVFIKHKNKDATFYSKGSHKFNKRDRKDENVHT